MVLSCLLGGGTPVLTFEVLSNVMEQTSTDTTKTGLTCFNNLVAGSRFPATADVPETCDNHLAGASGYELAQLSEQQQAPDTNL